MSTVFISWSRETESVAQALCKWLEATASNVEPWLSTVDIVAGARWREVLERALGKSDCSLACLGPSAIASPWVLYETAALSRSGTVIPITLQIPQDSLPPTLTEFQILNAFPPLGYSPSADLPIKLRASLVESVKAEFLPDTAAADSLLLSALADFAEARIKSLRKQLGSTSRSDMLLAVLEYIGTHPNQSLKTITEDSGLDEPFGKKFIFAYAIFWLCEAKLISIAEFDNIMTGRVNLSYDGSVLLSYLHDHDA